MAYSSLFSLYGKKFPDARGCLSKDKDVLSTFYDFPAVRWVHIRSTNPIESTFAIIRLRTDKTKGCGSEFSHDKNDYYRRTVHLFDAFAVTGSLCDCSVLKGTLTQPYPVPTGRALKF